MHFLPEQLKLFCRKHKTLQRAKNPPGNFVLSAQRGKRGCKKRDYRIGKKVYIML